VAGVEFLSFQGLWLVIAGFILGFAASTLWEWLYYRGKRQTQLGQAPPAISAAARPDNRIADNDEHISEQSPAAWTFSYRSPGVYLESEQAASADSMEQAPSDPQTKVLTEPQTGHTAPRGDVNAPRINPATLIALQAAVAQAPVAQPAEQQTTTQAVSATGHHQRQTEMTMAPVLARVETNNGAESLTHTAINGGERHASPQAPSASAPAPQPVVADPAPASQTATETAATPARAPDTITDHPDNLAMIKGVGEAYKRRLYGVGIYTWRQVAESDIETLRRITRAKPNANINAWREQARELAEKNQRWHTAFRGPLDDFTRIDGIGAITADLLYKAGICTYEQLAGALPDELSKIVPAPTVGDEIDFDGWIAAAVRLATVKRRNEGLLS
jgi:predicted flap endonuclease-1-like 5' DNA nuclease